MTDTRIFSVSFNEIEHRYYYQGKELYGITKAICKYLGKSFPNSLNVKASTIYGHDVHKEVELWIKQGKKPSTKAGNWIVQYLVDNALQNKVSYYQSELLVSDFVATASSIDIVANLEDGKVILYDIKTTNHFDRTYCSLQLSIYQYLYERVYGKEVIGLYVIATKSQRVYRIIAQSKEKIQKILEMNKKTIDKIN